MLNPYGLQGLDQECHSTKNMLKTQDQSNLIVFSFSTMHLTGTIIIEVMWFLFYYFFSSVVAVFILLQEIRSKYAHIIACMLSFSLSSCFSGIQFFVVPLHILTCSMFNSIFVLFFCCYSKILMDSYINTRAQRYKIIIKRKETTRTSKNPKRKGMNERTMAERNDNYLE